MHFSGNNRAMEYTKVARGKKGGTSGEDAKIRRGKGGFSALQMHVVVTAICTHARTLCEILLISYSFLFFACRAIVPAR